MTQGEATRQPATTPRAWFGRSVLCLVAVLILGAIDAAIPDDSESTARTVVESVFSLSILVFALVTLSGLITWGLKAARGD